MATMPRRPERPTACFAASCNRLQICPVPRPPWGMLTAVDMTEGKIRWQVPLGSMQDFGGKQPPVPAGSINLGGPIATAGGLVFIAGTFDPFIRAFDIETGKELWKAQLPAQRPRNSDDLSPGRKRKTISGDRGRRPS